VAEQRTVLLRHEQVASHTVDARLARWLLRARDLSASDTLLLTQEFLAEMLGVRRSSVSPVANELLQPRTHRDH
jgi:CRP-like cAMP-binding protein